MVKNCDFTQCIAHNISFFGADLRGYVIRDMDIGSVGFPNAKIDLAQCIVLAEALGAVYMPEDD